MILKCPNIDELKNTFEIYLSILGRKKYLPNGIPNQLEKSKDFHSILEIDTSRESHVSNFKRTGWIYIDYVESLIPNAFANSINNNSYIGINIGLLYKISDIIFACFSVPTFLPNCGEANKETKSQNEFKSYIQRESNLSNCFKMTPNCNVRLKASQLFMKIAINFIYYHETCHLSFGHIQFLQEHKPLNTFFEFPMHEMTIEEKFIRRCLEFHADVGAIRHTVSFMESMQDELKNFDGLGYNTFLFMLCSIATLFRIIEPQPLITKEEERTHPNQLARLTSLNYFLEVDKHYGSDYIPEKNELYKNIRKSKKLVYDDFFDNMGLKPQFKIETDDFLEYHLETIRLHHDKLEEIIDNYLEKHIRATENYWSIKLNELINDT